MSNSFQTAATPSNSARPLAQTSATFPRPQAAAAARPHQEGRSQQQAAPGRGGALGVAPSELVQVSCAPVPPNQTLRNHDPEPLLQVTTGLWTQDSYAQDALKPDPCALLGFEPPSSTTLAGTTPPDGLLPTYAPQQRAMHAGSSV